MKIVLILHEADFLASYVPLFEPLRQQSFQVIVALNTHPHLKPQHRAIDKLPQITTALPEALYTFFENYPQLARYLEEQKPDMVLTVEGLPFNLAPELFQKRSYPVYSLIHCVDNMTPAGVAAGVVDHIITPFAKYGEHLGWPATIPSTPLGNPKYDSVDFLKPKAIRSKYRLPENYLLMFAPNWDLVPGLVLWRIIRFFKRAGFAIILKGKWPKCHRWYFRFLADRYFLSERSLYPFIVHELLTASSGAIGFDTTAVEEALMFEKPLLNLSVKSYRSNRNFHQYEYMWSAPFCLDIPFHDHNWRRVIREYPDIIAHFSKTFDYAATQRATYTPPGKASERIARFLKTSAAQPSKQHVPAR
jgi:hypothetical protein